MKKTLLTPAEQELAKAFADIQQVTVVEEYRAYYDSEGWITGFAGSGFPKNMDNWVHIPRDLYITHNWNHLRLVEGKIVKIEPIYNWYFQLTKSTKGFKIVKNHAGIILNESDDYQGDTEYYEKRNS
jgi:hypothetical protein